MKQISFIFLPCVIACNDPAIGLTSSGSASEDGATSSDSAGSATATMTSASSTTSTSTDVSSDAGSGDTSAAESAEESVGTASSESASSGGPMVEPWESCAGAIAEAECEAVALSADLPQPSCRWRNVHTLDVTEGCTLLDTTPRCIYFSGYLHGCGGGPSCGVPNEGGMSIREIDSTVELLFYPSDEICGPLPTAAPDEPPWIDCTRPEHAACMCICEQLGL